MATITDIQWSSAPTSKTSHKHFELPNHLGNVLATVSDEKMSESDDSSGFSHFAPRILSTSDYYPLGLAMEGRTFSSQGYRWGFNGMERDGQIAGDHYDFGARIYNAENGRWFAGDAHEKNYPSLSTYSFVNNTPIQAVELDGKDWFLLVWSPFPGSGDPDEYAKNLAETYSGKLEGRFVQASAKNMEEKLKSEVEGLGTPLTNYKIDGLVQFKSTGKEDSKAVEALKKRRGEVTYALIETEGENACSEFSCSSFVNRTAEEFYGTSLGAPENISFDSFTGYDRDKQEYFKAPAASVYAYTPVSLFRGALEAGGVSTLGYEGKTQISEQEWRYTQTWIPIPYSKSVTKTVDQYTNKAVHETNLGMPFIEAASGGRIKDKTPCQ